MPFLEVSFNLPVRAAYTYSSPEALPIGCRVQTMLGRRKLTGWVVGHPDGPPEGIKDIREILRAVDTHPLFNRRFLELARWTADLSLCSLGEALAAMLPGGKRESRDIDGDSNGDDSLERRNLSDEQRTALDQLADSPQGDWFYLYGLTGSGKTEVFLREAERVMNQGRGVVYLVPEIALSHHLVEGLRHRFIGRVAVIHSGLTPSRRLAEWRRIQSGEALFVIGARSAVFAPLENPGLFIIDEEHEGSYKSGAAPRYHARQVAMKRCREHGARLLMGSATPSVEAWHLMESGRLKKLELRGRPAGGAMPEVRIVDLKTGKGLFSGELVSAMSRVLGERRQVLLFLNRRGFSYRYACRSCGEEVVCRHCSVPLTFHKSRGRMICHYCGFTSLPPKVCPECGSVEMLASGFGTEKVEEEVASLFPEKTVVRLDADAARKKGVLEETLKGFRSGDIDVLLGTQMVAKGLNAPGLKLAAVLSADTSLNLPDFRSAERTFSLIMQVAGRAGRFRPDGEVIVQTFRPDAPPVRMAADADMAGFYGDEIEQRRLLGFPPFSRLFRIVMKGADDARVSGAVNELAAALSEGGDAWELMGPAECPIGRLSGQFRRHIILRSTAFDRTHAAVRAALENLKLPYGVRIEADVDPVNLL